ncbi:MAG: transposase, partial [Cytophagales bacterium]|nr:transposase [Cytophagales bacterium]
SKEHAEFLTVTCLEWKNVLAEDRYKDIITDSLTYLAKSNRVYVYAFVIMSNHFHLIWQMVGEHRRANVQRDFLKYISQQILKVMNREKSELLGELLVNAKDRKYQVWERNSLSVPLWTPKVFEQKLDYIHNNPVQAGLCKFQKITIIRAHSFMKETKRIGYF